MAGIPLLKTDIDFDFRNKEYLTEVIEKMSSTKANQPDNQDNDVLSPSKEINEFDYEEKAKLFTPKEPSYAFNRVILPQNILSQIEQAIAILECEQKVFNEWGLYEIQPHPSTSLSFYGESGTGKTMAAEAIAQKLGKKIIKVSYADVESKFHGEGPKMVKAIFLAAKNADAVLFFDEADSLLSKRLAHVSQGSEQAINSMRSQLLISLEEHHGIVIFATNFVVNYDKAFLTRLISVEFPIPDEETRHRIWEVHVRPVNDGLKHRLNIPLDSDVDTKDLANRFSFVGRDIRNAVIKACVNAAMSGKDHVNQSDFIYACESLIQEKASLRKQDPVKTVLESKIKVVDSSDSKPVDDFFQSENNDNQ